MFGKYFDQNIVSTRVCAYTNTQQDDMIHDLTCSEYTSADGSGNGPNKFLRLRSKKMNVM